LLAAVQEVVAAVERAEFAVGLFWLPLL
jgi:hypothetical protein